MVWSKTRLPWRPIALLGAVSAFYPNKHDQQTQQSFLHVLTLALMHTCTPSLECLNGTSSIHALNILFHIWIFIGSPHFLFSPPPPDFHHHTFHHFLSIRCTSSPIRTSSISWRRFSIHHVKITSTLCLKETQNLRHFSLVMFDNRNLLYLFGTVIGQWFITQKFVMPFQSTSLALLISKYLLIY